MPLYIEASPSPTPLGRYRALSKRASIYVSPLVLGAQSIGDQWHTIGMGAMGKESSFKLMDAYFNAGGNFIDTANN
jgi:aryl-alcohol dehydrogenase-like predicted oxidoreductase